MIFHETKLKGAFVIDITPITDERGFFARSFCRREFEENGLDADFVQCNISHNKKKGILRGMHYQVAPFEETKLVRCSSGAIYDVIVDIRPDSPTFMKWFGVELKSSAFKMLYIPKGFAHGFEVLEDDTEVFYQMSEYYHPDASRGFRWNDPSFDIDWVLKSPSLSINDESYPDFTTDF